MTESRDLDVVGRSVLKVDALGLACGRGRYTDDVHIPGLLHAKVLRSPHAHARIVKIDTGKAARLPGVVRVLTGTDIAAVFKPYVGVLTHLQGMRSPPQHPMPADVARCQGEPVAMVVAESRAQAEDAVEAIEVEWEELPAALDMERALEPGKRTFQHHEART